MAAKPASRDYSLTGPSAKAAVENGLAAAQWYHTDMPRKEMKALMQRSDGPAVRDTALWLALLGGSGAGGIWFWGTWWCVPFFVVYGVLYGWQDRLADRILGGRAIQGWHVTTLANLGMTTQLAAFGLCIGLGHPLAFVWLLVAEALAVGAILSVHPKQEVSLEHR